MLKLKLTGFLFIALLACIFLPACRRPGEGKKLIAVIPKGVSHSWRWA